MMAFKHLLDKVTCLKLKLQTLITIRLWSHMNCLLPNFMLFLRHDMLLFNQNATGTLGYGIKAHGHL